MNIILIGIQGSGKSTQGKLMSKNYTIPFLSCGNIFREMAKENNKLGRFIKKTINKGHLVPDDKVVPIIEQYLSKIKFRKGYIVDGFPRTVGQAEAFQHDVDTVIYIEVSDNEALRRIAHRNDQSREDESVEAIKRRIKLFHEQTEPVIKYYKKKKLLSVIDGEQSVQKVFDDIKTVLSTVHE